MFILIFFNMSDQDLNLKFVGEVENHEELYNYKLPGYSRKDVTEKAWQQVAIKMNMSAAECKEKWRNLRTVFMRKMKSPPSGSGTKKKAYYLETAMQFCLPFIRTCAPPSAGNLQPVPLSSTNGNASDVEDISCASDSMESSLPVKSTEASWTELSSCKSTALSQSQPGTSEQQNNDSSVDFSPRTSVKKKFTLKNKSAAANADQCVAEYFKAKKAKLEQIGKTETQTTSQKVDRQEGLRLFLLSILPELEEFSDSQIKNFERRVFSLIDEISTPSQNQALQSRGSPHFHLLQPSSQKLHQVQPTSPQSDSFHFSEAAHQTDMSDGSQAMDFYTAFSQSL